MFPELSTDRLLLQQIKPGDQAFIFEGLSHPDVIKHYGVSYSSFEDTKAQLTWYEDLFAKGTGISWKMVEKATLKNVGDISVYLYRPDHNKAEVGFWLLPQFWHKGFAFEALMEVVRYWRDEKGLHRLEAFVEEENVASARLLVKAGFVYEGTMRDCEIKNGRYISLAVYGLLMVNNESE